MRATKSFFGSFLLISDNRVGQYGIPSKTSSRDPTSPAKAELKRKAFDNAPSLSITWILLPRDVRAQTNFKKPEKNYSKVAQF